MKAAAAREKPIVGVLLGDPSGIGPELVAKLLARAGNVERAHVVLLADPNVLALGEKAAGVALDARRASAIDALVFDAGRPTLVAFNWIAPRDIEVGQATVASGRTVLSSLEVAADAVRTGALDGVLFAPFNKHAMRIAGLQHEDEMRLLQHTLGVSDFVTEFNITGDLWTSRVTSHIPLAAVASAITQDGVRNAVRIIDKNLRASGVARPRIAVAGLNPHAGDGGSCGREEIDIIEPAVRSLAAEGLDARGPFPADTVFVAARRGDFDAVVTMYHDQGQIAMKLMGFDRGVTLLGGLPVPVATCASGSAFDIAGKGIANVEGLQQAFDLVVRISSTPSPLS